MRFTHSITILGCFFFYEYCKEINTALKPIRIPTFQPSFHMPFKSGQMISPIKQRIGFKLTTYDDVLDRMIYSFLRLFNRKQLNLDMFCTLIDKKRIFFHNK